MALPDYVDKEEDERLDESTREDDLALLSTYVKALKEVNEDLADLGLQAAEKNKVALDLRQKKIPELLRKHNLSEIKLASGDKVQVKEGISASVSEEKRKGFFDFLKKRGEDDIIKLLMQFGKMPPDKRQQLLDFLDAYEYDYEFTEDVHSSTLKAYFKKLLGVGEEEDVRLRGIAAGKFLRKEDVADVVDVYTYFDTAIKAPKGAKL